MAADPDKSYWGHDLAPGISSVSLQKIVGIGRTLEVRQGNTTVKLTLGPDEFDTLKNVSAHININTHVTIDVSKYVY